MFEQLHQQLVVGLHGYQLTQGEKDWLKQYPPLGIILFQRNVQNKQQLAALIEDARQCAGRELWCAIDEEGGRVNRISWSPFNRRNPVAEYALSFRKDEKATVEHVYQDSFTIGQAMHSIGFSHNCAPVLDIFHPSGHKIIGNRAYGDHVHIINSLGLACMRGLEDAGISAIGKHFPGHGRADADSHLAVPSVDADLNTLYAEAEPFEHMIQKGIGHLMTAHVRYPSACTEVATLSSFWMKDVLRDKMAFKGLIWTDDLAMRGVGDNPISAAHAAQKAGCDVLLMCGPIGEWSHSAGIV
ncbi:MAG: beta-N-acetylhexosaminidase [Mariprofundaceae bacterium]|nr:beta-N-acetylhexosaminidase [Mariprofundaceae bacterium]